MHLFKKKYLNKLYRFKNDEFLESRGESEISGND